MDAYEQTREPTRSATLSTLAQTTNKQLTELRLGGNQGIGDHAAGYLAESLRKNSTLTHLSLSTTQVTDRGAKLFAGMLSHNDTLLVLDLGRNGITVDIPEVVANIKRINGDESESRARVVL